MDEFVDSLLQDEMWCGITLPRLPKRWALQEQNLIKAERQSILLQTNQGSADEEHDSYRYEKD